MSVTSIDTLFLRVIREVELFKQLGRDDLSMLLRQAAKASFAAGEVVYEEGSEGQCMYVVVQGRFEVYRHANGSRMHLADVLPGEHFGEIALLGNGVRSASVVAVAEQRRAAATTTSSVRETADRSAAAAQHGQDARFAAHRRRRRDHPASEQGPGGRSAGQSPGRARGRPKQPKRLAAPVLRLKCR